MSQQVKCLLYKPHDLVSDYQHPCKSKHEIKEDTHMGAQRDINTTLVESTVPEFAYSPLWLLVTCIKQVLSPSF